MLCDIPSKHWSQIAFTFVTADLLYLKIPSQWVEFFSTLTLSGYWKLESVHMCAFLIRKGGYIFLLSYPFCLQLPCLLISRSLCCRSTQKDAALWFWVELISSKGLLKLNWLRLYDRVFSLSIELSDHKLQASLNLHCRVHSIFALRIDHKSLSLLSGW